MLFFIDLAPGQGQTSVFSDPTEMGMYIVASALLLVAVWLVIRTRAVRKRVSQKYEENLALIEQFERAMDLLDDKDDTMVIVGLQALWALPDPQFYSELHPILERLMQHGNGTIACQAKETHEKLVKALTEPAQASS